MSDETCVEFCENCNGDPYDHCDCECHNWQLYCIIAALATAFAIENGLDFESSPCAVAAFVKTHLLIAGIEIPAEDILGIFAAAKNRVAAAQARGHK